MNKIQTFEEFLTTQSVKVPVYDFIINIVLAALLAYVLALLYARYGGALSNRKAFARNFVMMTMTTMLIITIVKSSLALSLGLVGALSIVRFRAAIKEPEELAYLFLAIAIGLGLGADQRLITLVGFVMIGAVIWMRHWSVRSESNQSLILTVSSQPPAKIELRQIVDALKAHCAALNLRRCDDSEEMLEVSFVVDFDNFEQFEAGKAALRGLGESVRVTFLDNKGLA